MFLLCLALRFTSTILFLAASAALFTWRYTGKTEQDDRPANVGLITRGYFVNCWCAAHFVRGCSSGVQIFACSGILCTGAWDCKLLRGLADVPFCSAYFLFVMFLGYLSYTASGQTFAPAPTDSRPLRRLGPSAGSPASCRSSASQTASSTL